MQRITPVFAVVVLSGCIPAVPIVSDYNGDSVKIQVSTLANGGEAKANSEVEANRICAKGGKRAEFASVRQLPDYNAELLYLCL